MEKLLWFPLGQQAAAESTADGEISMSQTLRIVGVSVDLLASAGPGDDIVGPAFGANGVEWRIVVNLGGDEAPSAGHISIFLSLTACPGFATIVAKSHRITAAGESRSSSAPSCYEIGDSLGWGQFTTHKECARHLEGGVLTIQAHVCFTIPPSAERREIHALQRTPPPSLAGELRRLWAQRGDDGGAWAADVALVCGRKRLSAHAFLLSLRSPVFAALIAQPRAAPSSPSAADPSAAASVPSTPATPAGPSSAGAIPGMRWISVPEEISPEVMEQLLQFIYTDELPDLSSAEEAQHLLNAADHYAIPRLFSLCESFLAARLSVVNAAFTLTLADQHGAALLKHRCLLFMSGLGAAEAVTASEGWSHLKASRPDLVDELFVTASTGTPPARRARRGQEHGRSGAAGQQEGWVVGQKGEAGTPR